MDDRRSGRMQLGGGGLALAALLACMCLPASDWRLTAMQDPTPAQPQLRAGSALTPRRLVVCLDGTSNSDFDEKRRDQGQAVLKPTNVLKLSRAVLPWDKETQREQITYYEVGVGSLTRYPGTANRLLFDTDRFLGGEQGAGFESNPQNVFAFLACVPDLKQYLADLGVTTPLPTDVVAQIETLRQDCAKAGARPSS